MKSFVVTLAIILPTAAFLSCSCSHHPQPEYNTVIEQEKPQDVVALKRIEVLPDVGHAFIIDLKDGGRIKGVLKVETGKDAHEKVVKLINKSVRPDVVLYEHRPDEKLWVVDLLLHMPECVEDGGCTLRELSLTQWLVEQGLAWGN